MKITAYWPLLVLALGLLCYFPPWKNPKVNWFGQVCIWVGLAISTYVWARATAVLP